MKTYQLDPIDGNTAQRLRSEGGVRYVADSKPGYPCRQCLQDAEIGEALILIAHDPFHEDAESAFRATSPIFLHEAPCAPPPDLTALPDQLTVRQLSVRAFDAGAMMIDADVISGVDLDTTLLRFFADDETDHVQIYNASRGCWATNVRRSGGSESVDRSIDSRPISSSFKPTDTESIDGHEDGHLPELTTSRGR